MSNEKSNGLEHLPSKIGIAALLGGVALYDAFCPKGETISEGVERTMERPLGRLAVHALVWTTAGHLTRVIPDKYDWLHRLASLKDKPH